MSVRRQTDTRLFLIRTRPNCGKIFSTTAASPFMRQIKNVGGKKQKTCYFCSETCKAASYKHLFDGKAAERKAEYDRNRDRRESARRYYAAHAERERERAKARYWADPDAARAAKSTPCTNILAWRPESIARAVVTVSLDSTGTETIVNATCTA